MDNYEQLTPATSADAGLSEAPVVCVDQRSGRNIIKTGRNALSGLVHTSFEPINDDELKNVTIPYDQ